MTRTVVATSNIFPTSIPEGWLIQMGLNEMRSAPERISKLSLPERINKVVSDMFRRNPQIPAHDIYGLCAVILEAFDLLEDAVSWHCTLRHYQPGAGIPKPNDGWRLDDTEVLVNNHRYFILKSGAVVDPIGEFYAASGKSIVRWEPRRLRPYQRTTAQNLLRKLDDDIRGKRAVVRDATEVWFIQLVEKARNKHGLLPDAYSADMTLDSSRGLEARRSFEATLGALIPRMAQESKEGWSAYLRLALDTVFPRAAKDDSDWSLTMLERLSDKSLGTPPMGRVIVTNRRKFGPVQPQATYFDHGGIRYNTKSERSRTR